LEKDEGKKLLIRHPNGNPEVNAPCKGAAASQLLLSTAVPECGSSVAGSFLEKLEISIFM